MIMAHYAYLSKCCNSPCMIRGDVTKFFVCAGCKNSTDRKRVKFDTMDQFQEMMDSSKHWFYTASTTLDRPKKSCFRSNAPFLLGLAGLVLVGILVAVAAR